MTLPFKLVAAASATALAAACAIPLGAQTGADATLSCALEITETAGIVTARGTVKAKAAAAGNYALSLRRSDASGAAAVTQGGAFELGAGESLTLGQALFTGRARDITGAMTIEAGGTRIDCPLRR